MAERESYDCIGSDNVEGTAVYGPDQRKIGSIERIMIGKRSGKVDYAVLNFGSFLGMGGDHYPLPWSSLDYNTESAGIRSTSPKSNSKVRRNTSTKTIGIGAIKRAVAKFMTTTVSPGCESSEITRRAISLAQ